MLSLTNVSKTYVTKSKAETQALKNVNLDIADRGMVFILGKSGSGKSTLLNLLGGLDSPTSGEVFVDGKSMRQFSPRDYATYRNNYVGFIFQEFNLLADFNVRDNVALALRLSKSDSVDVKVTEALRKVELNEDYLSRRIDEMSGGEKQRIAIARALIKDSKLILADEPTGNLDSATGESIWKILKELSGERLVVVVSHDRESAEKYADRIIEIADGQIISDNGSSQKQDKEEEKPFVAAKQSLPFVTRLKMGYNTLKLRKAKTVSVVLLAIFSMLSILITQMCLSFSSELTLAKYIKQNDVKHFTVSQGYVSGYNNMFQAQGSVLKNSTMRYIADNGKYIKNGIISSKQDILDIGLSFVGKALELDNHSYYASTQAIEDCWRNGTGVVEVNGELVEIVQELHSPEFLIGKKVYLDKVFDDSKECYLAGVIQDNSSGNPTVIPQFFYNENFDGIWSKTSNTFNATDPKEVTLQFSNKQYDDKFEITDYVGGFLVDDESVIITADGIITSASTLFFDLADDEIVLPYELYAKIFDVNSKWYYVSSNLTEMRNMPQEIGQTFDMKFYEYGSDELFVDYGKVKLAGVVFARDGYEETIENQIAVSNKFARRICTDLAPSSILIFADSVKNLDEFVTTLRHDYNGYIENVGSVEATSHTGQSVNEVDIADMAYEFEQVIQLLSIVFLIIGAILLVVLVLLVINLISFSIANRKKEVGILSALGASNGDITSIFLFETLIISSISFVIILALTFIFEWAFNSILSGGYLLNMVFPFLRVDLVTVAIAVGASFGLLLLAALIPIRKIIKLKPIDAIRNV